MNNQYNVPYNINELFEQVSIAVGVFRGADFVIETINHTALNLLGRSETGLLGKPLFDSIPALCEKGYDNVLRQVYETGNTFSAYEIAVVSDAGTPTVYINVTIQALRNSTGKVEGVIALANNVTAQVEAKEKVRKNEVHLKEVIDQAPIGITIFNGPNFIVESANEVYLQLVDRTEESFVGRSLFESLPEVENAVRPLLEKVWSTGIAYNGYEFEVPLRRHGRVDTAYFNFVYQPIKNTAGNTTGIMVVASEVTVQVLSQRALAEQQKEFRNMVMHSPIAMTVFRGRELYIEIANETLLNNIWQRKFEEVRGKKLFDVFPELNDQKYKDLLYRVLDTGVAHRENESVAFVNTPDGGMNKFYLDFEYAPLHDVNGNVDGIMVTVNDVTDRVMARHKIEESENYFRSMTDSVPVMIFVTAPDGGFFFKNKQWYNYTGQTPEGMEGHGWLKSVHPQERSTVEQLYQNALAKHEPFNIEMRLRAKDGTYQWFEKIGTPRFDVEGNFMGYVGSTVNIHERKLSTEKLAEAEERMRMAADAAELGSWDIDLQNGDFVYSDRLLEMFGFANDKKYTREDFWALMHPEDIEHIVRPANVAALEQGVYKYEARIMLPEGVRWIKPQGKVYYDKQGKPARMIGTIMDITAEKKAAAILEESRLLFRTITEASPVGLWLSDERNVCVFVNETWVNWSGMTLEENLTRGWLAPVLQEDRDRTIEIFMKAVEEGAYFSSEFRMLRADGELRWYVTEGFPFYDKDGNYKGYAGSVTDITETKLAQEELERKVKERTAELFAKNEELERSNSELEQFAYIASHDLQEPLRKIQTFTELVQMHKDNPERSKEYFDKITSSAKRMSNLIHEVLNYSRLSRTDKTLYTKVDLNKLIADITIDFELQLKEKEGVINAATLPTINGIVLQLTQLFSNLVSNSLKFSPSKPIISIHSRILSADETLALPQLNKGLKYALITFSDNGIGFEQKHADQIFTIFQRLNTDNKYKGTGIGLAICKKVVQNHGGYISATSQPGQGATFNIYLPVA